MKLQPVRFDDKNPIQYEFLLETSGRNRFWFTLIVRFAGRYRDGSAGAPDAYFIWGITRTAIGVWSPAAVVLDLSELQYEWGDEMDLLLDVGRDDNIPSALVVGPKCERAIATLIDGLKTKRRATDEEYIFDNLEEAWEYVRKKA